MRWLLQTFPLDGKHDKDNNWKDVDPPHGAERTPRPSDQSPRGAAEKAYDVVLESFQAAEKIGVVRAVRLGTGASAMQSLRMVDAAPHVINEGMPKFEAESLKAAIEEAGGRVTLRGKEETEGTHSDQLPQGAEARRLRDATTTLMEGMGADYQYTRQIDGVHTSANAVEEAGRGRSPRQLALGTSTSTARSAARSDDATCLEA